MYVCIMLVVCMCTYVFVYHRVCVRLRVTVFQTRSWDPNSVIGDLELCLLGNRYHGDSKTDPWDDPEIRTGLCNEGQTMIKIQNYVISCECLLLSHFLTYHCQYVFVFYFYHFIWLFNVFYQCDYLHHFISHQWMSTLFIRLIWVFISIILCVSNLQLLA